MDHAGWGQWGSDGLWIMLDGGGGCARVVVVVVK